MTTGPTQRIDSFGSPRWRRSTAAARQGLHGALRLALALLLLSALLPLPAPAAEPTPHPLLRLETGMHTAMINRIATDREGRWAVTASDDKTARIWEVATGQMLGVLRPPQNGGNEGKLYSVAMSPDGALIAVGGWTRFGFRAGDAIYIFDRSTFRLLRRIGDLPDVVMHIAWSPDGRRVAAGLGGKNGVRVFDVSNGAEVGRNTDFDGASYSVEFSRDGIMILSTSEDHLVRVHEIRGDGSLSIVKQLLLEKEPTAARFSPDGKMIAIGFYDAPFIRVLDSGDLSELARPDTTDVDNGNLSLVAWSSDGKSLAAAGDWSVRGNFQVRRWSVEDWKYLGDTVVADNNIMDLVSIPGRRGGWLYASQGRNIGVLDAQGRVVRHGEPGVADLREQFESFRLARDALRLQFGFQVFGESLIEFDLVERTLIGGDNLSLRGLAPPRTESQDLWIDWRDNLRPTVNGEYLKLEKYERSRSIAIFPDDRRFVLGADWSIQLFDRAGVQLSVRPVPDVPWVVNVSDDGRWVVAGFGDGTIRWYRGDDLREVLAFFAHVNHRDWVLWTPEGFYAASPGGEGLIGYHVNRGRDREGEFISAVQLADKFYRPGLVSARLGPDGDRLMADAVKELGKVEDLLQYARNVPPEIKLAPVAGTLQGETEVSFIATLTDRGGGIGPVTILVDGQPVDGRQSGVSEGRSITRTFTVPVAPGQHTVQLAGNSLAGVAGKPTEPIHALLKGAAPSSTLHVLAVGVENYQDPKLRLAHSGHDAEALAADLARRALPVFRRVAPPRVLKDRQASLAGIESAFEALRAEMLPQDTLVIFLAGHGETRNDAYTFLPWDFRRGASGPVGEGLDEKRLFAMLRQSPARTLLLLDTCEAGSLVDIVAAADRINRLQQRAVIGASRKGELAQSGYQGHGVFTAALLQVLGRSSDGEELTPMELLPQVRRAVDKISQALGGAYRQQVQGFVGQAEFPLVRR